MKKKIALFLSLMLLCATFTTLAEMMDPMYATVGDALAAAGDNPIAGSEDDYYAVVTEVDGKYYRSISKASPSFSLRPIGGGSSRVWLSMKPL